jgi:hypothetical protein
MVPLQFKLAQTKPGNIPKKEVLHLFRWFTHTCINGVDDFAHHEDLYVLEATVACQFAALQERPQ